MKRTILYLCILAGLAAVKPSIPPARAPKDVASSGSNAVMRVTNDTKIIGTIPPPPGPFKTAPTIVAFAGTRPQRPPWLVTKSFAIDPVFGATGYRVYYSYADHRVTTNFFDIGNNIVFTITNLPPFRPMWFWATALSGTAESAQSQTIAYMEMPQSSWQTNGHQYYAQNVPLGHVIDVDAESKLNGTKRHVSTQTNINLLLVDEPVQPLDFFIITVR